MQLIVTQGVDFKNHFIYILMCDLTQFFLQKNVTFFEKKRKNPIEPRKFFRVNAI